MPLKRKRKPHDHPDFDRREREKTPEQQAAIDRISSPSPSDVVRPGAPHDQPKPPEGDPFNPK